MNLPYETKERYIIASPEGKIDATNADEFTNLLKELLAKQSNVIINFENVNYISSAGLRSILIGAKEAKSQNGKFILCCLQKHIFEIFEMTGFTQMLKIVPTIEEARSIVEE